MIHIGIFVLTLQSEIEAAALPSFVPMREAFQFGRLIRIALANVQVEL